MLIVNRVHHVPRIGWLWSHLVGLGLLLKGLQLWFLYVEQFFWCSRSRLENVWIKNGSGGSSVIICIRFVKINREKSLCFWTSAPLYKNGPGSPWFLARLLVWLSTRRHKNMEHETCQTGPYTWINMVHPIMWANITIHKCS